MPGSGSTCMKGMACLQWNGSGDRIGNDHKHDRDAAWRLQQRGCAVIAGGEDDIRRERNQFCRIGADAIGIGPCPTGLDLYVAPDGPVRLLQALQKCPMARLPQCIVGSTVMEHADAPHPLALLRARPKRPHHRRAAEQRDELAPADHSITSSAATCKVSGTVKPSILAVFRLIINSNFVGLIMGKSAGLSPLRTLPVYTPT